MRILKRYPARVRYVFKVFPESTNSELWVGERACLAAHKQNRFWEVKALLQDVDHIDDDILNDIINRVEIDDQQFWQDYSDAKLIDEIVTAQVSGSQKGIRSAPTFFVNGIPIPPEYLEVFIYNYFEKF